MNLLGAKYGVGKGILVNSLIFSLLHFMNPHFTILPFVNIFLLGLLFSLVFYLTDSIWMASAFHSFWNMAQANIFGISVSGTDHVKVTYFLSLMKENNVFNGGRFGIEGGIITSLVSLIGIGICLYIGKKKGLIVDKKDFPSEEEIG